MFQYDDEKIKQLILDDISTKSPRVGIGRLINTYSKKKISIVSVEPYNVSTSKVTYYINEANKNFFYKLISTSLIVKSVDTGLASDLHPKDNHTITLTKVRL